MPQGTCNGVAWSPDGSQLAAVFSSNPCICIINSADWSDDTRLYLGGTGYGVAWSPDGSRIAIVNSLSPRLNVFNASTQERDLNTPILPGIGYGVAWSPDGTKLALAHAGTRRITVLNSSDWSGISGILSPSTTANAVAWSADGAYLALAYGAAPSLYVYRTSDWVRLTTIPARAGTGYTVAWSPQPQVTTGVTLRGLSSSPLGRSTTQALVSVGLTGSSRSPLGTSTSQVEISFPTRTYGSSYSPLGTSTAQVAISFPTRAIGRSGSPLGTGQAILQCPQPAINLTSQSTSPLGGSIASLRQIDFGPDQESRFGFVIVSPLQITPTYSSATLTEVPPWDPEECYVRGEEVSYDGKAWAAMFDKVEDRLNKCKTLYNIGRNPATAIIPNQPPCSYPYNGYKWWKEVTTLTNPLLMFDGTLERETVATGTLEVHFVPATQINALCIFGITAATVRVESERYTREDNLIYPDPLYPSVKYHDQFIELDFPHEVGDTIKLFFTGVGVNLLHPVGMIRVGMVVAGAKEDLGLACYGTEVGIKDFSQKDRDVFGMPVIREETYSEWIRYDFEAETERLYQIKQIISKYRAQYVAYIGRDSRPETCIYGMMQDFSIPVETWSVSTGSLEVLGAPLAFHRPYCPVCPPGGGWEEGKTIFCGQTPCDDAEPIPEGEYGLCQTKTVTAVCGNAPNVITGMAEDEDGNVVEVGLNGALFINNKRTPFSPWYDMNWRDVAVNDDGIFVAVGDNGLIASFVASPPYIINRRQSPFDGANYHSVVMFWCNEAGRRLMAAVSGCGPIAYSVDGIEWLEYDDIPYGYASWMSPSAFPVRNAIAVDAQTIGIQASEFLAVTGEGKVWKKGEYGVWTDLTKSLTLVNPIGCCLGIQEVSGTPYSYTVSTSTVSGESTLAMMVGGESDWTSIEVAAGIQSVFSFDEIPHICTKSGEVFSCHKEEFGEITLELVGPALMGTLAPLQLCIASGEVMPDDGIPMN